MVYALLQGWHFDVRKVMMRAIFAAVENRQTKGLPFASIIAMIARAARVTIPASGDHLVPAVSSIDDAKWAKYEREEMRWRARMERERLARERAAVEAADAEAAAATGGDAPACPVHDAGQEAPAWFTRFEARFDHLESEFYDFRTRMFSFMDSQGASRGGRSPHEPDDE